MHEPDSYDHGRVVMPCGRGEMYSSRYVTGVTVFLTIALLAVGTAAASSHVTWTRSEYLTEGQGTVQAIQVSCGSQLILNSPYGAAFDLYAMRNYDRYGSCPGASYIRTHYDRVSVSNGAVSYLYLEPGDWCVAVYARYGSGQFRLESSSSCLGPVPPPYDPCIGDPCCGGKCQPAPSCSPYKVDVKSGYLHQGQSRTTGYYIPSGRSYIEWILTGPCGEEVIPMAMMSGSEVSSMRTRYCGNDFDLYIYRGTGPRPYGGVADYADTGRGANAYVGVSYPRAGSTYYAQVYAKSGSGQYTLTCRSYTCTEPVTIMMAQPDSSVMMYTATSVAPPS